MGERRNFSYRNYTLEGACRSSLGWPSENGAKDCRKVINAAKKWVRNATKVGPDDAALLESLAKEVDEAHGQPDLEMVAGRMRVRDALIWQLRNDRAENTAVNALLIKKMETYPPRHWDRLGVALYDSAQLVVQRLQKSTGRSKRDR